MATVLATFSVLKDHVKLKVTQEAVAIDNIVFKLHYRATFLILLISSLLVTSRQYIGEHIRCITDSGLVEAVINTFCFFTSTYTVVKHMNATAVEMGELPHLGVGPVNKNDEVVHHAYYQWVPFILFFQAILFYLPHYLWRNAEEGRLKQLVSGLKLACLALNETSLKTESMTIPSIHDREEKIRQIRRAFIERIHLNRPWAYYLGLCEVLNFINVLMQIYVTDWFLGGAFLGLGNALAADTSNGQLDVLDIVFPKVTKCIFHKYGPSGTIQHHDALCVMALNIVNEKIYVFLWYWFIILAVITGLGLVWRILTMLLHARSTLFNKIVFQMACPGRYNPWNVLTVTHECHFGDWLFLYYIAKNLDNYIFKELLHKLAEDMQARQETLKRPLTKEEEPLTNLTQQAEHSFVS
ncbi:PREDICTED: innexin inx7-like [Dufourea novaeangliae]|uniref:Innexin n=1 Tax=Dufourea novaeangliae TaxID=178035 RepID=A0A154NXH2_DUFNO|nr:PREDICTED: innexin inx7-like [Dufourea novaeangliae]KZC03794.1 Innexin inx7 [Dufourea novaeangliae]